MTTQLSFPPVGNPGKSKGYRFRTSRNDRTRYCRVKESFYGINQRFVMEQMHITTIQNDKADTQN